MCRNKPENRKRNNRQNNDMEVGEKMERENVRGKGGRGRDRHRKGGATAHTKNRISPGIMILLALFLAALVTAVHFYIEAKQAGEEEEGLKYEANIVQGDIPGKSREERQRSWIP